jgi:KDO transferase-3
MLELGHEEDHRYLHKGSMRIPLQNFEDCRNLGSGDLFLLASGSSAASFPVSRYTCFPFIAMNGSIKRLVDENIAPLFYVCDDENFVQSRPDLTAMGVQQAQHVAMKLRCFQVLHEFDPEVLQGKRLYLLERVNRYHDREALSDRCFAWSIRKDPELVSRFSLFRQKTNRIGFSRNMQMGYFVGRTSVYAATQLAYFIGFRRVFIIGMDLKSSAGRFYEQQQNALPTSLDIDFDEFILPSFKIMKENIIDKEDFKVFNLSPDSRMPDSILPKIDLEQFEQLIKNADYAPCSRLIE